MPRHGTVFLMYHELALPGRAVCNPDPGYIRYVVSASDFRSQMERLAREGWRATNVSQTLQSFDEKTACITFDDGCETDLLSAAPLLREFAFGATSYITVEYLGKPGYLTQAQVRELSLSGIEIGCHSLTHPYLTDIDDVRLNEETAGAKNRLEQIVGTSVEHFSCPGGRWDHRVLKAVQKAGFRTMATSRTGVNFPGTDPFNLARVAVLKNHSTEFVWQACLGSGLWKTRAKELARETARQALGNSIYDALRGRILKRERT